MGIAYKPSGPAQDTRGLKGIHWNLESHFADPSNMPSAAARRLYEDQIPSFMSIFDPEAENVDARGLVTMVDSNMMDIEPTYAPKIPTQAPEHPKYEQQTLRELPANHSHRHHDSMSTQNSESAESSPTTTLTTDTSSLSDPSPSSSPRRSRPRQTSLSLSILSPRPRPLLSLPARTLV